MPPALATYTTPAETTGVPSTAPSRRVRQASRRRTAVPASRVALGGCPSRARSPRYMVQSSDATPVGASGVAELPAVHAASTTIKSADIF